MELYENKYPDIGEPNMELIDFMNCQLNGDKVILGLVETRNRQRRLLTGVQRKGLSL